MPPLGSDPSLLDAPRKTIGALEVEAKGEEFSASAVAQLPRFLRTFYLRFLSEVSDQKIERFTVAEGDRISDHLVDLEAEEIHVSTWPLLMDFVDLCAYFDDFGLMSVPEAAQEHEGEIFELSARILYDLAGWAEKEGHKTLQTEAENLASRLESLTSGARAG